MWPINYQYVTKLKYMSILDVFFTNIKLIHWNINKITLLTSYIYVTYIKKVWAQHSVFTTVNLTILIVKFLKQFENWLNNPHTKYAKC